MEIALPVKTKKEISTAVKEFDYKTDDEFIRDAIEHRILALKKARFFEISDKIRVGLRKRGVTEEEILKDFEKFRRQK